MSNTMVTSPASQYLKMLKVEIKGLIEKAYQAGQMSKTDYEDRLFNLSETTLPLGSLIRCKESIYNEFNRSMPITGNYQLDSINKQLDQLERTDTHAELTTAGQPLSIHGPYGDFSGSVD